MATLDLQSKAEAAGKSLVDALALSSVTVTTGLDDDTADTPAVFILSGDGEEQFWPNSGIFRIELRFRVRSNANDETLVTHRDRAATVFDAVRRDTTAADLSSAVSAFHVLAVAGSSASQSVADSQSFVSEMGIEMICCARDL